MFQIPPHYFERLCEVFKIRDFRFDMYNEYDENGVSKKQHVNEYVWAIDVRSFRYGNFFLAGIQRKVYHRSSKELLSTTIQTVLMLPDLDPSSYDRCYEVLTLSEDRVQESLRILPLSQPRFTSVSGDIGNLRLFAGNAVAEVHFATYWYPLEVMTESILHTLSIMRGIYNNKEIEDYFQWHIDNSWME